MADRSSILLFGDQTNDYRGQLKHMLHIRDHVVLESFFARATHSLRVQISQLSASRQRLFPRFVSMLDLLAATDRGLSNPAIESFLVCLSQLGLFIRHHGLGEKPFPSRDRTYVLGLCTGALAAAAVSVSQSISELVPAGLQAIVLAFNVGLQALETSKGVESVEKDAISWSAVLPLTQEHSVKLLESALERRGLPQSSTLYLSAISENSVTISGPPKALSDILASETFRTSISTRLPIYAPFHAPHIYSKEDVNDLLNSCDESLLSSYKCQLPVISSASGQSLSNTSFGELLRQALSSILIDTLRLDLVTSNGSSIFAGTQNIEIVPFMVSGKGLASGLSRSTGAKVNISALSHESKSTSQSNGDPSKSKIAVIGYSGRFPEAASAEDLWHKVLREGRDVHREIPKDRFDVDAHFDASGKRKNTSKVRYGCFINEPGLFDTKFFSMSPREACNSDPGQRLALTTAYEALEMAGFVSDSSPFTQKNRVGIFYGMTSDDWREVNSGQNVDTYFIPGGNRAFTPGRINYHFKFSGPSFSIDTACSSSFAAIHTACNSLWRGDCDTAIAGGTNVMTNPDNFAGLDRGHFLSTTGNCNTYDDGANGYCRADAVGTVVLKRLEDAQADGDPIKAVIVSAYTNHSAEADSITRPHVGAQAFIFNKLLTEAAIDPLDVSYIEMHGTGTQAGDAVEMASVLEVFAKKKRDADHPLFVGSVKANVGHAESASGVTALIKVLKMMEENEIPPNCGIKTKINRNFPTDLQDRNIYIPRKVTAWPRPRNGKRIAFLNNFSAAGGNTALLLEDAPICSQHASRDERSYHIFALSAKSKTSLEANAKSLLAYLSAHSDTSLSELSFTMTARRLHHNHRLSFQAQDIDSLKLQLQASLSTCQELRPTPLPSRLPQIIFLFTGQGALYANLASQLYEQNSHFHTTIQRLDCVARAQGFPSFIGLIDGSIVALSEAEITITQLAMTASQIALVDLWSAWGITPAAVIGHSIGEFAALYASGIISANDAVFLVGQRAQLMQQKCSVGTHCMLAIKESLEDARQRLDGTRCEIACINGPVDTVVSGPSREIDAILETLLKASVKCTKLEVPFAFHSSQVEPILDSFAVDGQSVEFHKPTVPYLSPLLGQAITEQGVIDAEYLSKACRHTVDFEGALKAAQAADIVKDKDVWLEIGPHPICSNMVRSALNVPTDRLLTSLRRNTNDWQVLSATITSLYLAGFDIDWSEYHQDSRVGQKVLPLPAYQWDNKNYWIQYNNNFCLTKGDDPSSGTLKTMDEPKSSLSTAAAQTVVLENIAKDEAAIIVESDLHHPPLLATVQGHLVNGAALCPSSLWADVALTLTDYLLEQSKRKNEHTSMDVAQMNVVRPLIASATGPQLYRASATAQWKSDVVKISIYSVNAQGKKTADHANCIVKVGGKDTWCAHWKRNAYLIQGRIDTLRQEVLLGASHNIKRGLAYKLFGALVDYGKCYQGMEQVILNSQQFEATAQVRFQTTEREENHYISPFWIDSLGHIAGFIMNANDGVDSKHQVFINHGWDSMRCTTTFSREKTYTTYNKMQNIGGTMYAGDTYIFDGDEIVAVFGGIKFQGVPRKTLDNLLPSKSPAAASSARGTKKPTSRQTAEPKKRQASLPTVRDVSPSSQLRPGRTNSLPEGPLLTILADEVGLKPSELLPTMAFPDIGVDSLLSLTIASRIRDEMGVEVNSDLFTRFSTVGEVQEHLSPRASISTSSASSILPSRINSSAASSVEGSEDGNETDLTDFSEDEMVEAKDSSKPQGVMKAVREIVLEEIGMDEASLEEKANFGDLGVDSLLSLTILDKLRESFPDLEVPSDLFADGNTFADVSRVLGLEQEPQQVDEQKTKIKTKTKREANPSQPSTIVAPRSSSLLLQGNLRKASKILFLFPDGSGSATSYASLPNISPDVAIIGLNCPYMKTPQDMKCSLEEVGRSYIDEILRRQPEGPYYFGGWSAGGICAMDAAQELIRRGQRVERLILIDSPNPIGLEKLPPRLYDFFKTIGLFGEGGRPPPAWLLPHFLAFIDSLDLYRPKPFKPGQSPATHIIWAKDGVCKSPDSPRPDPREDDPREMLWLLENRTELGPNGWDKLIDGKQLTINVMEGVNHFSMMQSSKVTELAAYMKAALI